MGRKSKYTIEEKIQAVLDYKSGKRGMTQSMSQVANVLIMVLWKTFGGSSNLRCII